MEGTYLRRQRMIHTAAEATRAASFDIIRSSREQKRLEEATIALGTYGTEFTWFRQGAEFPYELKSSEFQVDQEVGKGAERITEELKTARLNYEEARGKLIALRPQDYEIQDHELQQLVTDPIGPR